MQVSGRTTRCESSRLACSMARMMLAVLVSKSPFVVLIWPIVTRIVVLREIVPDLRHPCNPRPFCLASQHALYSSAPPAEGSHNGSAAVLKTAGRKAMQVRVLSPPPFLFCKLPQFLRSHSVSTGSELVRSWRASVAGRFWTKRQ